MDKSECTNIFMVLIIIDKINESVISRRDDDVMTIVCRKPTDYDFSE